MTGDEEQPPRAAPAFPPLGRLLVLALLLLGLVVGGCLVITGGGDDSADTTLPSRPTSTLPLGDLSITGIESLSGIDVPEGAADYLMRMTLSWLGSPAGVDIADEDAARQVVRTQFLAGLVRS